MDNENKNDKPINQQAVNNLESGINGVSRWWEYYLVRYFVGTVFGTIIVLYIAYNSDFYSKLFVNSLFENNKFEMSYLWLFGFLGLAFCYLASSPVLVLHAFRSVFLYSKKNNINRKQGRLKMIWNGICKAKWRQLFLLYLVIPLIPLLFNFTIFSKWTVLTLVIYLIQLLLVIIELYSNKVVHYYKELTKKRASNSKEKSEYIESYRHIREHGNAFLIILFELLLGLVLYHVNSLTELIFVLLCWITPASLVWFLGNTLESNL